MRMTVKVGDPAPDFELFGERDPETGTYRLHRLSEGLNEGPIILHFFPAPFTRTCQVQMDEVRDRAENLYGAHGVTVWGVTGHYPWLIQQWEREYHFGVPILADYEHTVSEEYVGTYRPDLMSGLRHTTKRGVIGVGTDGRVRSVWVTDEPGVAPSEEDVEAAIDAVNAPPAA
jgi:thioredoxin-dependent peroxiredoxin